MNREHNGNGGCFPGLLVLASVICLAVCLFSGCVPPDLGRLSQPQPQPTYPVYPSPSPIVIREPAMPFNATCPYCRNVIKCVPPPTGSTGDVIGEKVE